MVCVHLASHRTFPAPAQFRRCEIDMPCYENLRRLVNTSLPLFCIVPDDARHQDLHPAAFASRRQPPFLQHPAPIADIFYECGKESFSIFLTFWCTISVKVRFSANFQLISMITVIVNSLIVITNDVLRFESDFPLPVLTLLARVI